MLTRIDIPSVLSVHGQETFAGSWARVSLAKHVLLPGFSFAYGITDGQHVSRREFHGSHPSIMRNCQFERRSLLRFRISSASNTTPFGLIRKAWIATGPILLFPETLPDLSEWLRWVCLDFSHHRPAGLLFLELRSAIHKSRLFQ